MLERARLSAQIDTLANFIMREVPGEPSKSEGAVDCAMRIIRTQHATIADIQGQLLEWKRALHSLTPGGSEYANDSKACVEWVREARSRQHETIIDGVRQRKELQQRVTQLEGERAAVWLHFTLCNSPQDLLDDLGQLLLDHATLLGLVQALPVVPKEYLTDDFVHLGVPVTATLWAQIGPDLIALLTYRASLPAQAAQGGA